MTIWAVLMRLAQNYRSYNILFTFEFLSKKQKKIFKKNNKNRNIYQTKADRTKASFRVHSMDPSIVPWATTIKNNSIPLSIILTEKKIILSKKNHAQIKTNCNPKNWLKIILFWYFRSYGGSKCSRTIGAICITRYCFSLFFERDLFWVVPRTQIFRVLREGF